MKRQLQFLPDGRVVDAVVGYRFWEAWVVDGVVHLSSTSRRHIEWPQGLPLEAECQCLAAHIEEFGHACGIYAFDRPIIPRSDRLLGRHHMQWVAPWVLIAGEVTLWGKVHRHTRGYRAQFARPSAFYQVDGMTEKVERIIQLAGMQWGVPVVRVEPPVTQHPYEAQAAAIANVYNHLALIPDSDTRRGG